MMGIDKQGNGAARSPFAHWQQSPVNVLEGLAGGGASILRFADDAVEPERLERRPTPDMLQATIVLRPHEALLEHEGRGVHSGVASVGAVDIVAPGERVAARLRGGWDVLMIGLPKAMLEEMAECVGGRGRPEYLAPNFAVDAELLAQARLACAEMQSASGFERLRLDLLAQEVAIRILRVHSTIGASRAEPIRLGGLSPRQVARVCEAMDDALDTEITLEWLANLAGCSPTHFSRAFKRSTGQPPFAWLLDRRIDRAKGLLRDSGNGLADIALAVGFSAQPQFTTAFKRVTGTTPGGWRRQIAS